jgi:endoglucanase
VQLGWDAVTDTRVTGYVMERCTGAGCTNFVPVSGTLPLTPTTYNDTSVSPATAYAWRVRATDGKGVTSDPSNVVTFSLPDTKLPAPSNLRGTIVP